MRSPHKGTLHQAALRDMQIELMVPLRKSQRLKRMEMAETSQAVATVVLGRHHCLQDEMVGGKEENTRPGYNTVSSPTKVSADGSAGGFLVVNFVAQFVG